MKYLGHRTICEIAFREVRDETRQRIEELMPFHPEFTKLPEHVPGLTIRAR